MRAARLSWLEQSRGTPLRVLEPERGLQREFQAQGIRESDVDDRRAVLVARMHEDQHVERGTAAEERRVPPVGDVHALRRRVDLQHPRAARMTALQLVDGVGAHRWIDGQGLSRSGRSAHTAKTESAGMRR